MGFECERANLLHFAFCFFKAPIYIYPRHRAVAALRLLYAKRAAREVYYVVLETG